MQIPWDLIIAFLRPVVASTETKVDDELLDLAEAAKNDPFIGRWFAGRVAAGTTTELSPDGVLRFVSDEPPQEIVQAIFGKGVFKKAGSLAEVAATLKELAPYIAQAATLIKLFTGK